MPGIEPPNPTAAFAALDPSLPLALLPVRMETRFTPDGSPTTLLVRLFPDALHADAHAAGLSAAELALGKAYWAQVAADAGGADGAFTWLADQLGAWRAAYVASQTRGKAAPPPLVPGAPVQARLLPERFAVVGYAQEGPDPVGTWWGAPIPPDLPMAPALVDAGDVDGRGLLDAQGMQWTYDFDAAVAVGMGLRIDLTKLDPSVKRDGFRRLLAIGVCEGDRSDPLEALLTAHRYTHGLDFIPQGTATNSTETAAATMSNDAPDVAAVRAAELDATPAGARPPIAADGDLFTGRAADAASVALGLGRGNALDKATQAGLEELTQAQAMARALWPATGGHYLDDVMSGIVSAGGRRWLRDWSNAYVRGGASLPTLLVGAQPYGLLPVTECRGTRGVTTPAAGSLMELQNLIAQLRWDWDLSLAAVPHLDPDATDTPPPAGESEDDQAAIVSQVMGAVPHGREFRLAHVDDMRDTYASSWEWRDFYAGLLCLAVRNPAGVAWGDSPDNPAWTLWNTLASRLDGATSLFHQQDACQDFADGLNTLTMASNITALQRADYVAARDYAQSALADFVAAHADRTEPLGWLQLRSPEVVSGMMGDETDPRSFFALRPTDAPWLPPLVVSERSDIAYADLRHWLDDVRQGLAVGSLPQFSHAQANPLLSQIVYWSAEQAVGSDDAALLSGALAVLQDILDGAVDDPVGVLERLLRETLGPWGHRLDAWYTALGAWRLENKRSAKPHGVQVGGFGWLVDVKPRSAPSVSQGYVLAPSLTHATSAAILRSGWSALGESLDVDLSSDRIRRAQWIVEGVRAGQDLGRLLGARFERSLQDAGLALRIDDFRQIALDAEGSPAPPNGIVDGLLLARARADADDQTAAEAAAETAVNALIAGAPTEAARLRAALDSIVADLDAVADAGMAQSVFSLAQGNVPEATAALTAAANGDITFPPLRFADTPREALTVTHRLLLMLDPAAPGVWAEGRASGRAAAAPALESWAGGLIGSPGTYRFSVRFTDPATGATLAGPFGVGLGEVGLGALDLVFLAPVGEDTGLGRLGAVLSAYAERLRPATVPDDAVVQLIADQGDPSVEDLAIMCRGLRRLLAEARDLDARDVATPGDEATSGFVAGDLAARVDAVRSRLVAARFFLEAALPAAGETAARGDVAAAMVGLSGFELAGVLPTSNDPVALVAQGQALLAQIDERLLALQGRIAAETADWNTLDATEQVSRLRGRLELLVGRALPLAPQFAAANGAALDASFARPRLAQREDATGWLAAAGRVDPGARRLRLAVDLAEAVRDKVAFGFTVGQLPDYPEEGWVAVKRPVHDDRGRLCLLATGTAPRYAAGPVCGLVLSSWTEALPRPGQSPGLALHFDAPSARAPQAVLLATVPDAFDFDGVREMVDQTLDIARLRMVGPETLQELGQFLPAVYLHGDTTAGGVA